MFYGICIHFSLPLSCLLCTGALSTHVWSMALMSGGGSTHTALLNSVEFKAICIPPSLSRPCCTRLSTSSHPYFVHLSNARVNQCLHSFIPYTGKLWNSLPLSVFLPAYDLNFQKRSVKTHLMSTEPAPLASFLLLSS